MRPVFRSFILICILCTFSSRESRAAEGFELLQSGLIEMKQTVVSLQDTVKGLQTTVQTQNEVIQQQAIRIEALETDRVTPQTAIASASPVQMAGASKGFNPDIGVVGTVQAYLTENTDDADGKDTVALKEIELNFGQYVDPYSRLDAVIAFNDALEAQNTEIEEAYYTHWGLPWGFQGRIGKFRSKIGKQNLLHLDQLPTVDYPLVIQDFFGEEGLSSSGVRLQNDIPNPWDTPITITGEVLRGNNGAAFSGISRRPIFNTHAATFFEITDNSNVELGATFMVGDENISGMTKGEDRFGVHVFGADATFNWIMEEGRNLKWQNEFYFQDRSQVIHPNEDPWGFYSLLDFRFSPKFSAGIRFDYLEPMSVVGGHERTTAISPYLTFWQSEFANFRLQYQHTDPANPDEKSDDAIFLQANFLIGSHQHPVQ